MADAPQHERHPDSPHLWRLGGHERFFGRKAFEAVDPQVATGEAPA
jgi:hypothetical protein